GVGHHITQVGIRSNEASLFAKPQAKHVVEDQHLNVAMNTGADSDRWNADAFRDHLGDLARYDFQHYSKRTRIFHCFRIVDQLLRRLRGFTLHALRAELVDQLRRQADVAHDADLFIDEPLHERNAFVSAFEFDSFRA